jgi:hypothetical protein
VSDRNSFFSSGAAEGVASIRTVGASGESSRAEQAGDPAFDAPPARPFREGLPSGFRMRADAHYVESLEALTPAVTVQYIAVHAIDAGEVTAVEAPPQLVASIKRHGVLEPLIVQRNNGTYKTITGQKRLAAARAAGVRDVPCLVHHVSDDRARALRDALSVQQSDASAVPTGQSELLAACDAGIGKVLDALTACSGLASAPTPGLTRAVAADLVRAEVWRTRCLFEAVRVVRYGVATEGEAMFPRELLQKVLEAIEIERRLRGVALETSIAVGDAKVARADHDLLLYGLSALLFALVGMLEGRASAAISLNASVANGRLVLSVSQRVRAIADSVTGPAAESGDPHLMEAVLAVTALRRVADAFNGWVFVHKEGAGARISIELPLEVAQI